MSEILQERTFTLQWAPSSSAYTSETKTIATVPWNICLQNNVPVLSASVCCKLPSKADSNNWNNNRVYLGTNSHPIDNAPIPWTCKAQIELVLKHSFKDALDIKQEVDMIFSPERSTYNFAFGDIYDVKADYMIDGKVNVDVTIRVKKFRYITVAKLEEEVEQLTSEMAALKADIATLKKAIFFKPNDEKPVSGRLFRVE